MEIGPIKFNEINSLKELHKVLEERYVPLVVHCTMEDCGGPVSFVDEHEITESELSDQILKFIRKSSVVEINNELNSDNQSQGFDSLEEFEKDKEYYDIFMLSDNINDGVSKKYTDSENKKTIEDILYRNLDFCIDILDTNKAFKKYIEPNFSEEDIFFCVKKFQEDSAIDFLAYDSELNLELDEFSIEEGFSLEEELNDYRNMSIGTIITHNKAHKILIRPIAEFILNYFKKVEVWKMSNNSIYFSIGRPYFFIGIFGYTHDNRFDGVVFHGLNEI